jgi:hypothetical protein
VVHTSVDKRWLEWQAEHAAALAALQTVERTYHRLIATRAFASPADLASSDEAVRTALQAIEKARTILARRRSGSPPSR